MLAVSAIAQLGSIGTEPAPSGQPLRPVVVIDTDVARSSVDVEATRNTLGRSTAISIAVTRTATPFDPVSSACDLSLAAGQLTDTASGAIHVLDPSGEAANVVERVRQTPLAALTLAWLLRGERAGPTMDALDRESAAYSMLLGSAEFDAWRSGYPRRSISDDEPRVVVEREGGRLSIRLNRPGRRNALDARMRDELLDALDLAAVDDDVEVDLSGSGTCFSSGGDLDEFGTASDPALAHHVRVISSAGAAIDRIRDRVTVRIHGACFGAGVELPAFAGRVIAHTGTTLALPELSMGLIPGAGGTVSIPRRIGRQRTLWLALSGHALPAEPALAWGLVDELA